MPVPRFREMSTLEIVDTNHSITSVETDGSTNTSTGSANATYLRGSKKETKDTVTKNFKKRSAKGEVIFNPFSTVSVDMDVSPGSFSYSIDNTNPNQQDYSRSYGSNYWKGLDAMGGQLSDHPSHEINIGNLRKLAGTDATAGVKTPEFAGLVAVAELREVVSLFRQPVKSWGKLVRSMQKAQRKGSPADQAKSLYDYITDNWLAYRYGVRPVLADIDNAMKAYDKYVGPELLRFTSRGFAQDTYTSETSEQVGDHFVTVSNRTTVSVRAGILYELGKDLALPSHFGFGLGEVPIAMYELIPFSFVEGWFSNVSSMIQALTPTSGVDVLSSWDTILTEQETTRTIDRTKVADGRKLISHGPSYETLRTVTKSRQPGVQVGFAYKPAPFEGAIGELRIIDAIALISKVLDSTYTKRRNR